MQSIYTETLPDGTSFDMIFVEGGEFMMGNDDENAFNREKPVHKVSLDDFYISKFPVIQAVWRTIMDSGQNPSFFDGNDRPVEYVSWDDGLALIKKLNEKSGGCYRLPTEAEWEYAARGGQLSKGYIYAGSNKIEEVAWYNENSDRETKDVGLKQPNELGLYDMSGNVWEWCQSWYSDSYYQECLDEGVVSNPKGSNIGYRRVLRGGSWNNDLRYCCSSYRNDSRPEYRVNNIGLRLVFSPQSVGS